MTLTMSRRAFVKTAAVGATSLVALPGSLLTHSATAMPAAANKPNIVILQSDQHTPGAMSCAGNPVIRTPNMDALAAAGVLFTRAVCPSPVCRASRTALITGHHPHQTGVVSNGICAGIDIRTQWTFPRALQASGYRTGLVGKTHFCHGIPKSDLDSPTFISGMRDVGFDRIVSTLGKASVATIRYDCPYTRYLKDKGLYAVFAQDMRLRSGSGSEAYPPWYHEPSPLSAEDYHDAWVTKQAVQWIDEHDASEPFFLWVNWVGPHRPWDAPEPYHSLYDAADVDMPYPDPRTGYPEGIYSRPSVTWSEAATRGVRANYYGMIDVIDDGIGHIVLALQAKGLLENTLIIYCADHGEMLGNHGLYNKALMFQDSVGVPLIISYPGSFDQNSVVDSPVNLLDLVPTILQVAGIDAGTNVQGKTLMPLLRGKAHAHKKAVFSQFEGDVMVMTDQYKYIWNPEWGSQALLFDYLADPLEVENLSGRSEYADLEQELNTMILDRGLGAVSTGTWHSPACWDQDRVPSETNDVYLTNGTSITVDADAQCRSLTVANGASLILPPGIRLTAEQFVINLGNLQQTQAVNGADVPFLEIQDQAGTNVHFRGANVSSSEDLGDVTVRVQGLLADQHCADTDTDAPASVRRCYDITATATGAALVRLWALTYELNGIIPEDLAVYHLDNTSTWMQLTANRATGSEGDYYAFAEGQTDNFSVFLLGLRDSVPTALGLSHISVRSNTKAGLGLLLSPPLLLGFGTLWALRRRQNAAGARPGNGNTQIAAGKVHESAQE